MLLDVEKYKKRIQNYASFSLDGKVTRLKGLLVESLGPPASIGDLCFLHSSDGKGVIQAEVVGFEGPHFFLMPYGNLRGIGPGCRVTSTGRPLSISVGSSLKGRVLNGLGEPIDGKGPIETARSYSILRSPPDPLTRKRIDEPFRVGIKSIDGCLPMGVGQRMGIFSGAGVGKSTLLGMISRGSDADVNVIALIGERGREVREFIENDLGEEGMKRSVVVVVTSDQSALMRIKGAYVATTIAEYFRDQNKKVLLMMDSLTRFAFAGREIGLSIGEPPTTKGFTPSVFSELPKLMERSGMGEKGSITAIYSVLVDSDDLNEPISDAARGILDGHIVLKRELAGANHYPAIDVLESISRLADEVSLPKQKAWVAILKEHLSEFESAKDLINIGAYARGSNLKIDEALKRIDGINKFLKQDFHQLISFEETIAGLERATIGEEI